MNWMAATVTTGICAGPVCLFAKRHPIQTCPKPQSNVPWSEQGAIVFEENDCARCHTPPLYTNNRLTPARGFVIPANHPGGTNLMARSVGTDRIGHADSARHRFLQSAFALGRVVPWPAEQHNGCSCAKLEDWFDPARLSLTTFPPDGRATRHKVQSGEASRVCLGSLG